MTIATTAIPTQKTVGRVTLIGSLDDACGRSCIGKCRTNFGAVETPSIDLRAAACWLTDSRIEVPTCSQWHSSRPVAVCFLDSKAAEDWLKGLFSWHSSS